MNWRVMWKNWCIFKVKVTARAYIIKYDNFCCICETSAPFATKPGLMVNHYKLEYPVKNWIAVFKVKVTAKDQNVSK